MNILLTQMLEHADPTQVAGLARFFKTGPGQYGEGDKFLGIKVPVTRAVVRDCWREMVPKGWVVRGSSIIPTADPATGAAPEPTFPELEECIASEFHEVRLAALLALVEIFRHAKKCPVAAGHDGDAAGARAVIPGLTRDLLQQQCIAFYLAHTDRINNWDLVDLSCYPLLGEWLLDKDRTLLYDLARDGRTLWEQRIGIVSTMTFIRHGQLADTFAIADILLHHPHDLIHKAVGWLLREAGKRDQAALEAYLQGISPRASLGRDDSGVTSSGAVISSEAEKSPRYLSMPRTMLRYAIERLPEAKRQSYLRK